ncbi:MAG: futalosine hydrolase [Trueperaceae bacterium]|nr:futalosine hydrolase [Trueperaceae bacterium]
MTLLVISATSFETQPLRDALTQVTELEFPFGNLCKGKLFDRCLHLAHLGIGKVNTAAGLSLAIEKFEPDAVIQLGIGGAFIGSFLSNGMVAVAEREIHLDSGIQYTHGWQGMKALGFPLSKLDKDYFNEYPTDQDLVRKFKDLGAYPFTFGTSEAVTGDFELAAELSKRFDLGVESMEGAAAAQVCLARNVPFAELRGISNLVGERNKTAWNIPLAIGNVNKLALAAFRDW